ncbi:hypothetical protein GC173_01885 [bacterium]|nr:hypothetical protein [bacterium]
MQKLATLAVVTILSLAHSGVAQLNVDALPLDVREVLLKYKTKEYDQAKNLSRSVLQQADKKQFESLFEYKEAACLFDMGRSSDVLRLADSIRNKNPESPYLCKVDLLCCPILVGYGKEEEAVELWMKIADQCSQSPDAPQAKIDLLRHFWKAKKYDEYIAHTTNFAQDVSFTNRAEALVHCGYIHLSRSGDLDTAEDYFDRAYQCDPGAFGESKAAMMWLKLLRDSANPDVDNAMLTGQLEDFVARTQGARSRSVDILLVAQRTYAYCEKIRHHDLFAASRLCNLMTAEPLFGVYACRASKLSEEISGQVYENSNYEEENRQLRAALQVGKANSLEALSRIDLFLTENPDSFFRKEALLRRAYLLTKIGKGDEASKAFEQFLSAVPVLNERHPWTLEARLAMKNLAHSEIYNRPRQSEFSEPPVTEKTVQSLEKVITLQADWRESLHSNSRDKGLATIEAAGLYFEQTKASDDAKEWTNVREVLSEIINSSEFGPDVTSVAYLMTLESHYLQNEFTTVVAMEQKMWRLYPKQYRELGTASYFSWSSLRQMNQYDEASTLMKKVRDEIPEDAPFFYTLNYHAYAWFDAALVAKKQGDVSDFLRIKTYVNERWPECKLNKVNW